MRDPNRIPAILDAARGYWEQHTDLRLGQVILSAARTKQYDDAFYIEDADLVDALHGSPTAESIASTRPIAHITEVLDAVHAYWTANSDLRLGQIIENAASYTGRRAGCFGLEDDELIDTLSFHTFSR